MNNFSSKYNKKPDSRKTHNNKQPVKQPVNHRPPQIKKNPQLSAPTPDISYKSAVDSIPVVKTITSNYLINKKVHIPEVYKHASINKLNSVHQLLILKEIKWGEL
jgi:hypothetical protein